MTIFLPNPLIARGFPINQGGCQIGFYGTPGQVLQQQGYGVGEFLCAFSPALQPSTQRKYGDLRLHQNTGLQRFPLLKSQGEKDQMSEETSTDHHLVSHDKDKQG